MKLTSHPSIRTTKVLVTGIPGSGKSTLVAQLAEVYNLIWIDLEGGASTLTKLPIDWQERIDLISLPDSASYPIASDTLTQLFKSGKASICQTHGKVNCPICKKAGAGFDSVDFSTLGPDTIVVIDSVTQLSHSILSHVTRAQPVDYKPEWDDWGSLRKITEFFCSQFQAVSFNLVCIAQVTEAKLDDNRTKLVPSFGSAGMSASFSKAFDHIVYCEVRNGKHVAGSSSRYNNSILTRSRTDFCIETLAIPSLLPVFRVASAISAEIVDGPVSPITPAYPPITPDKISEAKSKLETIRANIAAKARTK
jgi:hypothetical protein